MRPFVKMICSDVKLSLSRRGARQLMLLAWLACVAVMPTAFAAGDGESTYVVVKAAHVITVSGEEFSPGIIVIEDGRISAVGSGLEYPASAKVIHAVRETVTPGLILPRARNGLPTYRRTGVHGDQQAASEVYLDERDFEDYLKAGYTSVGIVPDGEGIVGLASAYRTAGDDDARLLKADAYVYAIPDWGSQGKANLRGAFKKAREEIEKVEKARKEWDEKKKKEAEEAKKKVEAETSEDKPKEGDEDKVALSVVDSLEPLNGEEEKKIDTDSPKPEEVAKEKEAQFVPPKIDPKYQPLVDMIQHKDGARMLVRLERASDLLHMFDALEGFDDLDVDIEFSNRRRSSDLHQVIEKIGEKKLRILLTPSINYQPHTTFRYNAAAQLAQAGAKLAFTVSRDIPRELRRGTQHIAELVRAGLPIADALRAVTLEPAMMMGVDKEVGSIEKDKSADLVFWDSDPLDPHGKVNRVMILGEIVWESDKSQ